MNGLRPLDVILPELSSVIILEYCQRMKSIIVFASGKGSNAEQIIKYFEHSTDIRVSLIISNKADAGVLDIARQHNIPQLIFSKNELAQAASLEKVAAYRPDLIVLAGFLLKIPDIWIKSFPHKIINIHPALLPKFGGKGMYGMHVHEAVIAAREKTSGITIHYVNEHYDEGAPILQAYCTIEPNDHAGNLASKISRLEHHFLPSAIDYLIRQQ